jgi:transposase
MVFLTELGDMRRFTNRRKVAAFLGVVPSSNESGESANDRKGHITRQGPGRVRKVLCQASWASLRYDEDVYRRWTRIKGGKQGRGKKALVAIMRQLGIRMWHLASSVGVSSELVQAESPPPCWTSAQAPQTGAAPFATPSPRPQGCAG